MRVSNQVESPPGAIPGFRRVPRTGVIYVMHRAAARGYRQDGAVWSNLGQGSPESGPLPGAPPRLEALPLPVSDHAYAPVGGLDELRERVAELYNELYRRDRRSRYGPENVCIAPGGRAAMTRVAASLGEINMGHFIPDYTAYEELLSTFRGFIPIPILLDAADGYRIRAESLRAEIVGRGLSSILFSNPCNPTGQVAGGAELAELVALARELGTSLVLDEFYSHYVYDEPGFGTAGNEAGAHLLSAAAFVEDVEEDPVILVDGLTKNWRYPGWRISWILGPSSVIEQAESAGSFLDGGASHPFQRATIPLLDPELTLQESRAIRGEFLRKRSYMLERLEDLGIRVEVPPRGAFYAWGDLSALPPPLDDGMRFFEAGLEEQVITVPGVFFDVNPGRRRSKARYQSYSRFSFGPEMEQLERGLDGLERVIRRR
jgi:hypothetical protein